MPTTKPTLTIRYATPADSDRLTDFRISQFKTAKEFELIIPELLSMQSGYIFLVEQNEFIVSTMQLNIVTNSDYFRRLSLSGEKIAEKITTSFLPSMYLSKAATIKELRNSGLNSYLRMLSLNNAILTKINSLTGVAFENAPRLHLLEKLGYSFTEIEMASTDYVIPKGKSFFLQLASEFFFSATKILESEIAELKEQFTIINLTESTWLPSYLP